MRYRSTLTSVILTTVVWEPGHTATWIAKYVHATPDAVSSILARLALRKRVRRVKGCGPRGGYGYYPVKD